MRCVLAVLVVLGVVGSSGCGDDGSADQARTASSRPSGATAPSSTGTETVEDRFRRSVEEICDDVTEALVERAPRDGATPEAAAEALTSMVQANRDGVDRMRELEVPPDVDDAFTAWLDLVDETAKQLEVGSLALRAGDEPTFTQALGEAEETGAQASAAALDLGLPECAFTG